MIDFFKYLWEQKFLLFLILLVVALSGLQIYAISKRKCEPEEPGTHCHTYYHPIMIGKNLTLIPMNNCYTIPEKKQ